MAKKISKDWEKFEKTVAHYLKSLDPNAEVIHNTKTVDTDTGQLRQRDVWIQSYVRGNQVKTLVSCKFWKNKLDVSDIDTFVCEFNARDANIGVIYAKSGFTKNAVLKKNLISEMPV